MDRWFNRFLDWFDRLKWAIMGTMVLHLILVGALSVWQVRTEPTAENKRELNVEVIDDAAMEELMKLQEEIRKLSANGPVQNLSSDLSAEQQSQTRSSSYRPLNSKATDELVEEELRQLEEEEFQRLAEERTARGEDVEMPELDPEKWKPENYMPASERVRVTGRTTTSYYLEGRGASIPTPAYICEGAGSVRILIKVDRSGSVRSMELDPSSNGDQCMVDAAMKFVSRSSFEPRSTAPSTQNGWIQFTFVAQ